MKAIIVTLELKNANTKLFINNEVGSIRQMKMPKSLVSLNYNAGQRTDGYHTLDNSIHEADGFYDVVTPAFDVATEKLGAIEWDAVNSYFTFPIVALTQEELDVKAKDDDKEAQRLLRTVVWEGETQNGNYYILTIKDDGKLESILIP